MSKKQSSLSSPNARAEKEIINKEEMKPGLMAAELDEIRKYYSNPYTFDNEVNLLNEFGYLRKEKILTENQQKRKNELFTEIGIMYGLENGIWVSNLGYGKDYATLARMRQKVIKDYDCKTSLELMLSDSIVACYWRIIKNERTIGRLLEKEDNTYSFDQLKVNILKELNKEVDSANRRLNMNIILLKEMKQPALKVNVRTNNAFIGENQQFNNNPVKKDENNDPK